MTQYAKPPLDAIGASQQLQAAIDRLVEETGDARIVWRVARVVMETLRLKAQIAMEVDITSRDLDPERVLEAVAYAHGTTVDALRGRAKDHATCYARHHAAWELRLRRPDLPLGKIGHWLNRRDHVTVLNSLRRFNIALSRGHYAKECALVERTLS